MYCCGANGMVINLPAAKSIVADRQKLSAGKKYPLVIDIRTLLYMDREAREYFASAAATKSLKACALLISSPTSRILADFFIKFHKPAIPTRAFNNLESAEKWLKSFVETSELI